MFMDVMRHAAMFGYRDNVKDMRRQRRRARARRAEQNRRKRQPGIYTWSF